MNGTITLFLGINGVLSINDASIPLEQIGNSHAYLWAYPIPQARALLKALDQHKDLGPVWCSHWGKRSPYWNYWSGTWRWLVGFPLKDEIERLTSSKMHAIQQYLELSDKRGGVWVQDGFTEDERAWAEWAGVRLVDTAQEPVRSLLLSREPGAIQVLMDVFAGDKLIVR